MIAIVGAGLTGLSCALALRRGYRIFEREGRPGGLCRTERRGGFTIDHTGHYLHFTDPETGSRVRRLLAGNLLGCGRNSWVRLGKVTTPYPFQANLAGHDPAIIRDCVIGLFRAREGGPRNRADADAETWVRNTQGDGFARHFMIPFNEKQFRSRLSSLVPAQWGRFAPLPDPAAVVRGALRRRGPSGIGYNAVMWHPRRGGIESLPREMARRLSRPVETGKELSRVRWRSRTAVFNGREEVRYSVLVSTAPLPELLDRIDPLPRAVRAARRGLRHIGVLTVHLCVRSPRDRRSHWIYFPEGRYVFYRFGYPANINPADAPRGCGIISAEVSYGPGRRPAIGELVRRVKRQLRELEALGPEGTVLDTYVADAPFAYVVHDRAHARCRRAALRFLARARIVSVGRYGGWGYGGMEDALREGREAGEGLRRRSPGPAGRRRAG